MKNRNIKVTVPIVKISRNERHVSARALLYFVVGFGLVGSVLLWRSFAGVPVVASLEAEQMPIVGGSSVVTDTAASGGKAMKLTQNGTLSSSVSLPSDASSVTVTARADQCSGSPTLAVTIDGVAVVATTAVGSTTYSAYSGSKTLPSGNHTLSITGANLGTTAKGNGKHTCARNLYIDITTFYGSTPPVPVVAVTASPSTVVTGASTTLSWNAANASACSANWTSSTSTTGTQTITPTATNTYAMTCTGSGGTGSSSTTVTVSSTNAISVPSTIASDCSVDVTSALLSWVSTVPNNSTLAFGSGKCYRIDGTVELRGRSGLTFEGNGSTFKSLNAMTTGSATDDQRAMFRVIGSTGMAFKDMTIVGAYTHGGTLDSTLQHAHGIDIRGTSAEVANTNISNVAGDCVYFGLGYDNVTRSSGSYHDSTCTSIGRNGLAVTAANNFTAQHNIVSNVGFDAFDVEPNVGSYTSTTGWGSSNITIDSNTIQGYYRLYAYSIVTNASNIGEYFTNNKVIGNGLRIGIVNPAGASVRATNVNITGNTADTATWAPALETHLVDILNVTNNTIPMSGGTMATVDSSCKVNVSGNIFTGGTTQFTSTNPTTGC